jgi:hypothetical protein
VVSIATREVATWNFEYSAEANLLLSNCLHELDSVIRVRAQQVPASTPSRFGAPIALDTPYLVLGVVLPSGHRVYRVSFRSPLVQPVSGAASGDTTARFTDRSADLIADGKPGFAYEPVGGGRLVSPVGGEGEGCSSRGFWGVAEADPE